MLSSQKQPNAKEYFFFFVCVFEFARKRIVKSTFFLIITTVSNRASAVTRNAYSSFKILILLIPRFELVECSMQLHLIEQKTIVVGCLSSHVERVGNMQSINHSGNRYRDSPCVQRL